MDIGAMNHIINNLKTLNIKDDYHGQEKLTIGNNENMPITKGDKVGTGTASRI